MLTAVERFPLDEMLLRRQRCRSEAALRIPDAQGMLVFSRLNIYYLTGTLGNGVLWLPREGEPVLLVRRGAERCRLESPLAHIFPFRSWAEIPGLCAEAGVPLPASGTLAAEMGALPWALSLRVRETLPGVRFVAADAALAAVRAVKTPWELTKLRLAGQRHARAVREMLVPLLHVGMSEREVAHAAWKIFFSLGHGGPTRMGNYGEDCFLGHIAAGDNGNFPSHFNGPLGLKGEHPACPFMGDPHSLWQQHTPLAVDIGFVLEAYNTDKTQVYWAGSEASVPDAVRRAQDACLEIQQRAAEGLRTGAIPSQLWEAAQQRAEALGVSEGFMGLGGNKVHFLGHGIGLVIDETPVLARRFDAPLRENMVLSI